MEINLEEIDLNDFILERRTPSFGEEIEYCLFEYSSAPEGNAVLRVGEVSYKLVFAEGHSKKAHKCKVIRVLDHVNPGINDYGLALTFEGELSDFYMILTLDNLYGEDDVSVGWGFSTQRGKILERY